MQLFLATSQTVNVTACNISHTCSLSAQEHAHISMFFEIIILRELIHFTSYFMHIIIFSQLKRWMGAKCRENL